MPDLLPEGASPRITQRVGAVDAAAFERVDALLVVTAAKPGPSLWRALPGGAALKAVAGRADDAAMLTGRLANRRGTGIVVARRPAGATEGFGLLKFVGGAVTELLKERPRRIGLWIQADNDPATVEACVLAVLARGFALPSFRSAADPGAPRMPAELRIFGLPQRLDLARTLAEGEALNLARWLTALPPNRLDAPAYRALVQSLAATHDWQLEVFDEPALARAGAGAFLAVAQGNADREAAILRLRYRPRGSRGRRPVALVGKGIIFDTGGNNLKPFKSMLDMHEDMAGSAVALATLVALTRLGYEEPVDCWLAITENRIGPTAYKSRDVVTACNGTTIEVIHTDAEGRMALADTLALAGREHPRAVFDYATLTGACVHALTERYSGLFTNRPALEPVLVAAGRDCGERVWSFPLDSDYDEDIKSERADVAQCSPDGSGDHILAARFLQRFVPDSAVWVHLDLSAAARKGGLAHVPPGPTGFGVRYTLAVLLDRGEALESAPGA